MRFSEVVTIIEGEWVHQMNDVEVDKFTIDSRKLIGRPSEIFLAIKGERNNGHAFIRQAYEQGVRNFIVEEVGFESDDANIVCVPSSIKALQQLATFHRRKFSYPVIGITGSNGKTTVKEWLSELLSTEKKVVKSPRSFNSQVGVPLSVLEMGNHDIAVFEAGISQKSEMQKLAEIILPTIGIFTNIGEAHSGGFSSRKEKIEEKACLFNTAESVICRMEHADIVQVISARYPSKIVTWSLMNESADYVFHRKGTFYELGNHALRFTLPFDNDNQVENALHAIVTAVHLGLSEETISKTVANFRSVPMRLELKRAINRCYIIDDSYNNDLVGLEVALDFMNQQNPHQSKAIILSDILQSSLLDEELYGRVKRLLKAKGVEKCFVIGERISQHFKENSYLTTRQFVNELPAFENETILVKGARNFEFERIVQRLQDQSHGTVLEINLESLRNNLNAYRALLTPTTKLMVMVKAFAYGAGLTEVASFLQHERVDYLGAAYLDEAVQVRKKGITLPIMIMNPEEIQFELFERFNLEAEIFNKENLERLIGSNCKVGIHLKLETGMNRLGFSEEELNEVLPFLANPALIVKGVFTHFSSSDDPSQDEYTHQQATTFNRMVSKIEKALGYTPLRHVVNSPGMIRFPQYHFDMTRLGIGLHGFDPTHKLNLDVVATLSSHVSQVKKLKAGDSVGYSRKGTVKEPSEIAIIPIGYADGYLRVFGNGVGKVLVNGMLAPTIGNVCMDMVMLDVTGLNAKTGDRVVLFGHNPTIKDVADWSNTIPYEVLTNISQRVKRIYVSE